MLKDIFVPVGTRIPSKITWLLGFYSSKLASVKDFEHSSLIQWNWANELEKKRKYYQLTLFKILNISLNKDCNGS